MITLRLEQIDTPTESIQRYFVNDRPVSYASYCEAMRAILLGTKLKEFPEEHVESRWDPMTAKWTP